MNQSDYLRALFKEGEWTCFAKNKYGTIARPINFSFECKSVQFITLNPLLPNTSRLVKNISEIRNLLIEFDLDLATPESQLDYMNEIMPNLFTTAVYSGGKSMHFIIALNEGIDRDTYKNLFWRLSQLMPKMDSMVSDPSRLTRLGGALRQPGREVQTIYWIGKPVYLDKLLAHLDEKMVPKKPTLGRRTRRGRSSEPFKGTATYKNLPKEDRAVLAGETIIPEGYRYNTFRSIIARIVGRGIDIDFDSIYNKLKSARIACGFTEGEDEEMIIKSIEGAIEKKETGEWS